MQSAKQTLSTEMLSTIIDGKLHSLYFVFKKELAKNTINISNGTHRVLIDVGNDGIPVAIQIIGDLEGKESGD